jgi:hypothetical protein
MDKEEKPKEPKEAEIQREVSFRILGIKKCHYDKKDLIGLVMTVDEQEYEMKFLLDNYNVTFFPEFKVVDKYLGNGGFKFIHSFLESIYSKISYYSEVYQKEKKPILFNISEKEWWQKSKDGDTDEKKESTERLDAWVKKNEDYLVQHDLSGFDNEKIEEVIKYLEVRKSFVQPEIVHDEIDLNTLLESAINNEDYETAIKIREQLKQ